MISPGGIVDILFYIDFEILVFFAGTFFNDVFAQNTETKDV